MTIGIYKLTFTGTNKVYIGKSLNIEHRYKGHLRSFKNERASVKMQEAYNTFGSPTLEVLEVCIDTELELREQHYIDLYNAVVEGFNSRSTSVSNTCNSGDKNHMAIYSNAQIIECFNLLVDAPDMLFDDISNITGVPRGTITMIARGVNHKWLKEYNPTKYRELLDLVGSRKYTCKTAKSQGIKYPPIINPHTGEIMYVESGREFARIHGLDQAALGRLLNNKAKSHKGWKLA